MGCGCAIPQVVIPHVDIHHGHVKLNAPAVNAPVATPTVANQATVVVKADRDVQLKLNGQVLPRRGTEELFSSPTLTPGRMFTYKFVAEVTRDGKTFTDTKDVLVQAGRRSELDFSNLGRGTATAQAEPGNLTVVLPEGSLLTVNNVPVDLSGKKTFQTPPLEKNKAFAYSVKAEMLREGKLVTETRSVQVMAGKSSTVDFTRTSAAVAAHR